MWNYQRLRKLSEVSINKILMLFSTIPQSLQGTGIVHGFFLFCAGSMHNDQDENKILIFSVIMSFNRWETGQWTPQNTWCYHHFSNLSKYSRIPVPILQHPYSTYSMVWSAGLTSNFFFSSIQVINKNTEEQQNKTDPCVRPLHSSFQSWQSATS